MKRIILLLLLPLQLISGNEKNFTVEVPEYRCIPSMNYGGCTPGTVGSAIQCRGYGIENMYINFTVQTAEAEFVFGTQWMANIINPRCHYERNNTYYYMETDQSKTLSALSVTNMSAPGKYSTGGERFFLKLWVFNDNDTIGNISFEIVDGNFTNDNYTLWLKVKSEREEYIYSNVALRFELASIEYTGTCADCNFIGDYLAKSGDANSTTPQTNNSAGSNTNTTAGHTSTAHSSSPAGNGSSNPSHSSTPSKTGNSSTGKGTSSASSNSASGNSSSSNSKIYNYVDQMPEFKGNLNQYISDSLHYPQSAIERNVEGRVIVRFVVSNDGSVENAEIVHSVDPELDKEALRVVQNMPAWKPGIQNGKAVSVIFNLPIDFKLQ